MDANLKRKWVTALRSGQYRQATGMLRTADDSMCCLGVLLDVSGECKWSKMGPITNKGDVCYFASVDGGKECPSIATLPTAFIEKHAFNLELHHRLTRMNDDGKPFAEIADYIESNL